MKASENSPVGWGLEKMKFLGCEDGTEENSNDISQDLYATKQKAGKEEINRDQWQEFRC